MTAEMSSVSNLGVCVFCGSSAAEHPSVGPAADALATVLADRGHRLVYGGASVGIMGRLADAALARGVEVDGVIPAALFRHEVAHRGLTRLHEVDGMQSRKMLMADLSDMFVALPGGFGTLDELFEVVTWRQIGLHDKPIGLLDVDGYWDGLASLLDRACAEGFIAEHLREALILASDPEALVADLEARVER